jgi:hypothetical protein
MSIIIIIIIIITGTTALCEPWPSSEIFAILLYYVHHQGENNQGTRKVSSNYQGFLLRNVGFNKSHTA